MSFEQFLHVSPPVFSIILCVLSRYDNVWIDSKVLAEMTGGTATPTPAVITLTQQIANGAASFNIHIVNVLLFLFGAFFAVFDWPRCIMVWPMVISIVLFAVVFYDVILRAMTIPLSTFERSPPPAVAGAAPGWSVGSRLRAIQIGMNAVVIVLIIVGILLGGADNTGHLCRG